MAVAEPRDVTREAMAERHNVPSVNVFKDWKELAQKDRLADAVVRILSCMIMYWNM